MAVSNADIAAIFYQMADLLEIEGANTFRVRAYRSAADSIERTPHSLSGMVKAGEPLTGLPGIGPDLAEKIQEIVRTGKLAQLEEIRRRIPPESAELLKVGGLGPRRVRTLYTELGVKNIKDLRDAVEKGKLRDLPGFGEKLEQNIRADLKTREQEGRRFRIDEAEKILEPIVEHLRRSGQIERLEAAGSYRRRKETVGDLDVLAISPDGAHVIQHFTRYSGIREVMSQGDTRSTVILNSGMQVDLRVVPAESYGAALFYFTGSRPHNLHLRRIAIERGWKVNEYGIYRGDEKLAGETEDSIYTLFGLPWIPPELREDSGEIEAAQKKRLPALVTLEDIRGDFQSHTRYSDGKGKLAEMAAAAREQGRQYLAITDHSRSLRVARGMQVEDLARQIDEIDRLNENWQDFRLLKSCEVDILEDGSLDMPDDLLDRLDLTVCSIHTHFNLPRDQQTERILRAMDNPHFNIFAHPTGRLLNRRAPYDIDLEQVIQGAKERGCFLELNAHPERLDLNDTAARLCKQHAVLLALSTDAHAPAELALMRFGVDQARRGWLEKPDLLNTRPAKEVVKMMKR